MYFTYFIDLFSSEIHVLAILLSTINNAKSLWFWFEYDQNPSGFCFLVQLRAFVIQTSLGLPWLQNLNVKGKTKRTLVVVVKWRHRANGPLHWNGLAMILLLLYNLHILASDQKSFCLFRATFGPLSLQKAIFDCF